MEISITNFYAGREKILKVDYLFPLLSIDIGEYRFSFSSEPILKGKLIKQESGVYGDFRVDITLEDQCALCLRPIHQEYHCTVCGYIEMEEDLSSDREEEIILAQNGRLSLSHILELALLENIPQKLLCKEDCQGLCEHCGVNLNDSACRCMSQEQDIDPRLEKLKEWMK